MRKLLLIPLMVNILAGQRDQSAGPTFPQGVDRYIATASTTALTVQQSASNARQVIFEQATVYCASACTATPSWNGTAATSTTLAIIKAPGVRAAPTATAWSASNVGSGTTGVVYNVPAGGTLVFDMTSIQMGTTGTTTNFTYTTSGTATISVQWREN